MKIINYAQINVVDYSDVIMFTSSFCPTLYHLSGTASKSYHKRTPLKPNKGVRNWSCLLSRMFFIRDH